MAKTYESMSISELEVENRRLQSDIDAIRAIKRRLAGISSRKEIEAEARRKLAAMSDDEKAAAQAILAKGIKSKENIGTPGV